MFYSSYSLNMDLIFTFKSLPLKSMAIILPFASNKKVLGILETPYRLTIGSFISFKLETCNQVIWSFAIADSHLALS